MNRLDAAVSGQARPLPSGAMRRGPNPSRPEPARLLRALRRLWSWRAMRCGAVALVAAFAACTRWGPTEVAPAEIPALEARLADQPGSARIRARYAAALFVADRCDQAVQEAERAQTARPADALSVLVIGQCAERARRWDRALAVYRAFSANHPRANGVAAVRAREQIALRAFATEQAREALAGETRLSQVPGDPNTIAVLPVQISSPDSSYQPLSRGLAQIITSDLSLIRRFHLVERLQLRALLDEMELGHTVRVDAATAARMGHLIQAGRMVQGLAAIPPEGAVRLEANVVLADGQVVGPQRVTGAFRSLLALEKALVIGLAGRLGYVLTEAERQRILENGTRNLTAFLAYSRGLVAEDAGDYGRAAEYFSSAVRADPGFQAARQQYQASAMAAQLQRASPGQVTAMAAAPPPAPEPPLGSAAAAVVGQLNSGLVDLAPNLAEQTQATSQTSTIGQAMSTPAAVPPPTVAGIGTPTSATGTISIVFRLP